MTNVLGLKNKFQTEPKTLLSAVKLGIPERY